MAQSTIINNELSSPQSGLRIDNPFFSVHYFDKPGPVSGGSMYFGIPGTDPELPQNQKRVYYVQEDGSVLPIAQPVKLSNGGVPSYNGSPAKIAIDGNYSWRVLDRNGQSIYYSPRTSQPALQQVGEARIIEEVKTLSAGQNTVNFDTIDLSTSVLEVIGPLTDSGPLLRDDDYNISDGSAGVLYLVSTYPAGTKIRARQNAFSDQVDSSVSSYAWAYDTIAEAASEDLREGNKVIICGASNFDDSYAFHLYRVVPGGTGINDGERFINMDNGLQLQSLSPRADFKNYSEETVSAPTSGGVMTIDVSKGVVQLKDLTESVNSIVFANVPSGKSTTVTIRVRQQNGGGWGINFNGFFASGGNAPTITQDENTIDVIVFSTFNGTNWYVYQAGEDMRVIS